MKFQFSGNLLRYVNYSRKIEVDGSSIVEGIKNVVDTFPRIRQGHVGWQRPNPPATPHLSKWQNDVPKRIGLPCWLRRYHCHINANSRRLK